MLENSLLSWTIRLFVGSLMLMSSVEAQDNSSSQMVKVRVIGPDGSLTAPMLVPKVKKTDAEWQKELTPEQYQITRAKGTEPAFCGNLLDNHREGIYHCVDCGLPLFSSDAKFNSRTGWPSFFQPIADALPLLQMTLRELFDARDGMTLTWRAYEAMGGASGAIATHAGAVLADLLPAVRSDRSPGAISTQTNSQSHTFRVPYSRKKQPILLGLTVGTSGKVPARNIRGGGFPSKI